MVNAATPTPSGASALLADASAVEGFVKDLITGYNSLKSNGGIAAIAAAIPAAEPLMKDLAEFVPGASEVVAVGDILVKYGPAMVALGRVLGAHGHDFGDRDDALNKALEEREEEDG